MPIMSNEETRLKQSCSLIDGFAESGMNEEKNRRGTAEEEPYDSKRTIQIITLSFHFDHCSQSLPLYSSKQRPERGDRKGDSAGRDLACHNFHICAMADRPMPFD
jgi:hypothetical protein